MLPLGILPIQVEAARAEGARIVAAAQSPEVGAFAPAVVLDGVDPRARIAREEVFGPVVVVLRAAVVEYPVNAIDGQPYFYDVNVLSTFVAAAPT
jgi:acyl-CoA reductase-like NAD-dependent aldehyde dehydrogenase